MTCMKQIEEEEASTSQIEADTCLPIDQCHGHHTTDVITTNANWRTYKDFRVMRTNRMTFLDNVNAANSPLNKNERPEASPWSTNEMGSFGGRMAHCKIYYSSPPTRGA